MLRVRIFTSMLSMLSFVVAGWAWMGTTSRGVVITLLLAATCLAVVSPFDAPNPRQRTRVVLACLAYVAALATAVILARATASSPLMSALFLLGEFGIGLACWAIATRNRRRMSGLRRYYDN